ncbi:MULTISPECIES: SDR family NAD(P)-dependent oxidoreductase [Serratia]|jgi:NAD(P)-dependent dehydrogenase (short-subunit alcohol dehydrogenase family)|uniref:2-(R)-hydroxypropyl-CoM dehydrogenase n=2 Tax=Serratia TaxID=613 RepID=A0A379ZJX8_9GAMM|nr:MULTISPECIES: SDR family oxidoreductase [Serratia]QBX67826.1 SDR family oxidoreductase [Serratia quinivorans]RYM60400.1 short-chain dehydrogenase [Serratia proteamaculans]CAI2005803.1 2-(R)-hydroxypropyl-CoM dehydrogenase [Serratia quinivorans]SUI63124.1 2-(R)-hydroxypropyl-CoM dehydrogenase [Serratia quinivorans]
MFAEKTILITGASSGLGKAMAEHFLAKGANIVINGLTASKLDKFLAEHLADKDRIALVAGDIGLKATSDRMAQAALDKFGSVDVLINNAGIFVPKPFLAETEENLDRYYASGVKGPFFASQAVIPTMIKQGGGSIINIGSMWVEHPLEATPSSASQVAKGGMHTLTRHLAIEFAKDNIRVNTVAPGVIETPLYDDLMDKEAFRALANLHPLRKLGKISDIIAWVDMLAGEGSRFVTGQTLFIDGGITAGNHVN